MRHAFLALALALVIACGCASNSLPAPGDGPAPIDLAGCLPNCPDIAMSVDLSQSRPDFSGSDLSGLECVPTCNHCTAGGACCPGAANNGCCGAGEWCDNGTCRCGGGAACTNGEFCASGGPIPGPGGNQCGVICCGGPMHPCPL